jgi:hypothetical protein
MAPFDLDACIAQLLRKQLLHEVLLREICEKTKEVLMRESNVVHVSAPVTVVGDIHGSVSAAHIPRHSDLIYQPILRSNRNISDRRIRTEHELSVLGYGRRCSVVILTYCFLKATMWIADCSLLKRFLF